MRRAAAARPTAATAARRPVAQADAVEHRAGAVGGLGALDAVDQQRDRRVLGGRQRRQEVERLEHEADRLPARAGLLGGGHLLEVAPEDAAVAGVAVEDAGDRRDQRRLPAAGRSDEHEQLAGLHVEVDPAQAVTFAPPVPYVFTTSSQRTARSAGQSVSTSAGF
jgi:hypothetical protein